MARRYGKKHREFLATVDYDEALRRQKGHCALCPRKPSANRRLDRDHDHKRMVFRGLLCHRCNRAIPSWAEPDWFRSVADYLEESISRLEGEINGRS